jgi:hypothetical protein
MGSISVGEGVFPAVTLEDKELKEFIKTLPTKARNDARTFLINAPTLSYVATYKSDSGEERKVTLSSLMDFFTFR